MGDSPKHKMERLFTAADAAEFFANLAEGLKQGVVRFNDSEVAFEGQVKIKGELKAKESKTGLKLSLKFPGIALAAEDKPVDDAEAKAEAPDEEGSEPGDSKPGVKSYKKLKKKMKAEFKEIQAYLGRDEIPPMELIETFQADCQIMTSVPENGDEYYKQFNAEAYEMLGAAQSGDLEGLKASIGKLSAMKNACHERHK